MSAAEKKILRKLNADWVTHPTLGMNETSPMNKKLFAELVESMTQMNEIARGERAPSWEFHVEPLGTGWGEPTGPTELP